MARSAVRARGWSLTTASFAADLALYIVVSLTIWLVLPALFLGWTPVMVSSGSMSPAINPGDLILLDDEVPGNGEWYVPGTIVTFEDSVRTGAATGSDQAEPNERRLVTHRVERFETAGGYITRGDANAAADPRPVEPQQVVGAARLLIPWLGLPVHWARTGQLLNLAALLAGLLGCIAITTREVASRQVRAVAQANEATVVATGEQAVGEAQARPIDEAAPRPIDDAEALGARAARAARAAGKSSLSAQEARDQQRREQQPDRKDVRIPPASAMLLVVALSCGIWASASASPSQAAFAATTASAGNTFAMAPAADVSFDVAITSDLGTEYCADVAVSTTSATPVVWEVELDLSTFPLNGVPYSVSNATTELVGQTLSASGNGSNDTVVAGGPATWGFCAKRPATAPTMTLTLPDLNGTGSIRPVDQNDVLVQSYSWELDADVYLAGPAVAELRLRRTGPGNSPGYANLTLRIDGQQAATGASGTIQGSDAWQLLTVAMSPTLIGPLSADSIITLEVELYRVEVRVGGPSSLRLVAG